MSRSQRVCRGNDSHIALISKLVLKLVVGSAIIFTPALVAAPKPAPVASATGAFYSSPPASSPFGINGVGYFFFRDSPDAEKTASHRMDLMDQAGIAWDRFDFWWSVIEPEKGKFVYNTPDQAIALYRKHHIQMMPILSYSSAWGHHPPADDAERAAFAGYASKVVHRYHRWIHAWEIWNEPNIPTFWKPQPSDRQYPLLLKAASKAIHDADPQALVVGGATSETDTVFLRNLSRYGAWDSMDVVSIHPYSMSDGPVACKLDLQIQRVKDLMHELGKPKPIWITEMGWTADPGTPQKPGNPHDLNKQSAELVQSYAIALANGVQRLFWFNLVDFNEKWGLTSDHEVPKPSFDAYRVMSSQLNGARPAGMLPQRDGRAYVFARGNETITVAWANRGKTAELHAPTGSRALDLYGKPAAASNGAFPLSENPIYVISPGAALARRAMPPDPHAYYASNLVVNGDFSLASGGSPYGWHRGTFDGQRKEGDFSAVNLGGRIIPELAQTMESKIPQEATWESFYVPIEPGHHYRLTARIKPINATGVNTVSLGFLGGAGWGWKQENASPSVTGDGGWQNVTVTAAAPADAAFVRVHLNSSGNTGAVQFDNVRLQEIP